MNHLSDCSFLQGKDGELYMLVRVSYQDTPSPRYHKLFSIKSVDGISWTDTVTLYDGYFNTGTQITPDTGSVTLGSPTGFIGKDGTYYIMTFEDTSQGRSGKYAACIRS